jgi:hypothetical protein
MDKITNWYDKLPENLKRESKLDKNFKKHYILPNSMVACIGGTGTGKTNALIDFLMRKTEAFYEIIIYTGSTSDEPLYNLIKEKLPDVELYNDIDDLPSLSDFDTDSKKQEKLIVFDDFINLKTPQMKKINEYLTGGRKFGFTCWVMAQNYTQIPKTVVRNINYFILFKLNDNFSIDNIIRNHNIGNVPKESFKNMYIRATAEPRNFFLIDLKTTDPKLRYRHNFLNFLTPISVSN